MSPEREATVIAEIRRTHAQLRNGRVTAEVGASGIEWSMRFTVEEVDVLIAIVDERDDLKRRLLSDWEPDFVQRVDADGVLHREMFPDQYAGNRPGPLGDAIREMTEGAISSTYPMETAADLLRKKRAAEGRELYEVSGYDPTTPEQRFHSCPRRDTVHDCPLGGCADASPRPSEIPDVPRCDALAPDGARVCRRDSGHEGAHQRYGHSWANEGRESRETPPVRPRSAPSGPAARDAAYEEIRAHGWQTERCSICGDPAYRTVRGGVIFHYPTGFGDHDHAATT